jgi:hypothetical protein
LFTKSRSRCTFPSSIIRHWSCVVTSIIA